MAGGVEGEPIRRKLIALRAKEQDALRRRLERAQSVGDLPSDADAADLARFVTALFQGTTEQAISVFVEHWRGGMEHTLKRLKERLGSDA